MGATGAMGLMGPTGGSGLSPSVVVNGNPSVLSYSATVNGTLSVHNGTTSTSRVSLGFGNTLTLSTGTTGTPSMTTQNTNFFRAPRSGTLQNLYFTLVNLDSISSIVGSVNQTFSVGVYVSPSPTNNSSALTTTNAITVEPLTTSVTIAYNMNPGLAVGSAVSDSDTTHTVNVNAGDLIALDFRLITQCSMSTMSSSVSFNVIAGMELV